MDFFKFPSTVHLIPSQGMSRSDKVMPVAERTNFLQHELVVEEKLDGANIGISRSSQGNIRIQNRGNYLSEPFGGQFSRLPSWLAAHADQINSLLEDDRIIFGEWCAAKHSIEYRSLPDFFIAFDIYDVNQGRFWSATRRDRLVSGAGLHVAPKLDISTSNVDELVTFTNFQKSHFADSLMEGIVLRQDDDLWNVKRAKLVRDEFRQSIDSHWSRGRLIWNSLEEMDLAPES